MSHLKETRSHAYRAGPNAIGLLGRPELPRLDFNLDICGVLCGSLGLCYSMSRLSMVQPYHHHVLCTSLMVYSQKEDRTGPVGFTG